MIHEHAESKGWKFRNIPQQVTHIQEIMNRHFKVGVKVMRWVIKYAVKSMKQNWLRNMLIALGAALGVMLATMLLLEINQ